MTGTNKLENSQGQQSKLFILSTYPLRVFREIRVFRVLT